MEEHDFIVTLTQITCNNCSYIEYINHTHEYIYTSCRDGLHHYKTCDCGFRTTEECFGYGQIDGLALCRKCGQIISRNGNIIINIENIFDLSLVQKLTINEQIIFNDVQKRDE